MSRFTVLGATGFVGRNLCSYLQTRGHEVLAPTRGSDDWLQNDLGHVIYAIGLTGNFRVRLYDTIEAHVEVLAKVLKHVRYESFLYLSSTRVYGGLQEGGIANEESSISVVPSGDSLYDLSKLLGEALCLGQQSSSVRVIRLSNVYGMGQSQYTFLQMLIDELSTSGMAEIRESPFSVKDYVSIDDVVQVMEQIALYGRARLYNVGAGQNVSHQELAQILHFLTGLPVTFKSEGERRIFPSVDVSRIKSEFGWKPKRLADELPHLIGRSNGYNFRQVYDL